MLNNTKSNNEYVSSKKVSCHGSGDFSRHPEIYLNFKNEDKILCPYCGKIFKYVEH